jgi:hypothetical protein
VILEEIRALEPLPDETDPSWDHDSIWARTDLLIALADLIAARRLEQGIGLVLDKMCFGDPGEVMRSMRHSLEAAISPDWRRLAEICGERCASERAGTRYWAVQELGVLREPSAMSTILNMFEDREREVALVAFSSAAMVLQWHPELRATATKALRTIAQQRKEVRDEAQDCIRDIQRAAPATGSIDHPDVEPELVREIRANREGKANDARIAFLLELLLTKCLAECEEWDGTGVSDGLVAFSMTFTAANTLELRGQMTSFKDRGHCVEPFEAYVSIADQHEEIESATIKYGDASSGLGAVEFGKGRVDPERVSAWLFVFQKQRR